MTHSKNSYYIRSVLFSNNPTELCHFYEQYGAIFKCIKLGNIDHYISSNTNLCILEHDETLASEIYHQGLIIYELSDNTQESVTHRINNKGNLFLGRFTLPKDLFLLHRDSLFSFSSPLPWISIIRSENIEETREFYCELGSWQREKHGDGPTHYALIQNNQIFEIYPLRKNESETLESLIPTKSTPFGHYDPDGRKIYCL